MADEVLLHIRNVNLTLGGTHILRGVNGEIKKVVGHGQVVGLLGPSGIGKTQMFRVLSGLQAPTSGTITINTHEVAVHAGLVGVVAQDYQLFRHYTVKKNLLIGAKQGDLTEAEGKDKITALLNRFDLTDKMDLYPKELSGGQRQRIAIAQQVLCSKHFLLMDEPFSGLDPLMLDEVCNMITEVANMDGLNTIIVVTHDIRAAIKVADTLWLMGRDRDKDNKIIPGAYIKYEYDLKARGLAYHPELSATQKFTDFAKEIKDQFKTL